MKNARRARLILVLLLLSALTLIALDFRSGRTSPLRRAGSDVFGPIENGVSDAFRPVGSFFAGLGHVNSYKSENRQLRAEIDQLKSQNKDAVATQRELTELRALTGLANNGGFNIVAANVTVVGDALGYQWTAALDVGSSSGIKNGESVIDGQGLVGKIEQVSSHNSTVLLACDPQFDVAALIGSTGEKVILKGEGLAGMKLSTLNPQVSLNPGQRVVTAGIPPFDAQIPIGAVASVETGQTSGGDRVATLAPFVSFTTIDYVGVVVSTSKNLRRGALITPISTPSAKATANAKPKTSSTPSTP